jgi:hypothetical protein
MNPTDTSNEGDPTTPAPSAGPFFLPGLNVPGAAFPAALEVSHV